MSKNKIVLVLEDEIPLQNAIKSKLGKNGFDVITARNTSQAMNHLKDVEKVDLIWVDHYLLGEETGLDFVAHIKNDKKFKDIPVLVVANTASDDKVSSYIALGINKYYTKSDYRLDEIILDINNIINRI